METLPVEMRCELAKYLTSDDLKEMRLLSSSWNELAKDRVRSRHPDLMTFTFCNLNTLARFNDTFLNYEPKSDLHSAKFGFMLPTLASVEVSAHLDTFAETFGQSVTTLTLGICRHRVREGGSYWLTSKERELLDKHVTLLMSKVKGQLSKLTLNDYIGLSPAVFGSDPFPALTALTVANVDDVFIAYGALERLAAIQQPAILELSRKVPAIREFNFGPYELKPRDDPAYLANLLRNLALANPEVESKLHLRFPRIASNESLNFVQELARVDTRIRELRLKVPPEGADREDFRLFLQFVGGQSNRLRKLTLNGTMGQDWLRMRLPNMLVLEELTFSEVYLMATDDVDYLPRLRRVTMDYPVDDLAVTFSSVRDLTLVNCGPVPEGDAFRLFAARFPNLWSLTCWIGFLELPTFYQQQNLTRLKVSIRFLPNTFWEVVTQRSPKLTFGQIVDLDVTSAGEIQGPSFKDLRNLREVIFTGSSVHLEETLEACLYLSKLGRLKRLQKLSFEVVYRPASMVEHEMCLRELQKYHNGVTIILP